MQNAGIVRMNLTGLEPELRQKIKAVAEAAIRDFDGAPEHFAAFTEARELLAMIDEIDRQLP